MSRPDRFTTRIRGKLWRWVFTRLRGDADGLCDPPETPGRSIYVHAPLPPQRELTVIIHEALHAAQWDLSEEAVTEVAEDIARAVWKRGFRPV